MAGLPLEGSAGPKAQSWLRGRGRRPRRLHPQGDRHQGGHREGRRDGHRHPALGLGPRGHRRDLGVRRDRHPGARAADGSWSTRSTPACSPRTCAPRTALDLTTTPAPRADILGAGGQPLVTARPVVRLRDRQDPGRAGAAAGRGPRARPAARRGRRGLRRARQGRRRQGVRRGDRAARERRAGRRAPAVRDDPRRRSRCATSCRWRRPASSPRPLLGSVGPVTAEMVKQSEGGYVAGDEAGLSGLQQRYDEQLRGTPGVAVVAAAAGRATRASCSRPSRRPATPLRTTLDPALQTPAEKVLATGVGAGQRAGRDPALRRRDLLAAASGPGSAGYSTATLGPLRPRLDVQGGQQPGAAAVRAQRRTASCRARRRIVVDGKRVQELRRLPVLRHRPDPARARRSPTPATPPSSRSSGRSPPTTLAEAAAALGLGVDHDLGFPVFFGSVPTDGSETEHAASTDRPGHRCSPRRSRWPPSPRRWRPAGPSYPVLLPDVAGGEQAPGPRR